ncbi:hypothetical protein [Moraxella lacunata]|uniref:hypothetical protein n=1 Tax=Moraxella lacunata TaxID=477 RepID=UPI003EDED6E0
MGCKRSYAGGRVIISALLCPTTECLFAHKGMPANARIWRLWASFGGQSDRVFMLYGAFCQYYFLS